MTWEPFVVALVMTGSFAADSEPKNPCDVLARPDFVHIAGRCFYLSPSGDKFTFNETRRLCQANGLKRLAILNTEDIRQGLNREDDDYRWVGMQPIIVQSDLRSAKWVDNTSAQDVFDGAFGRKVEHVDEPRCLAVRIRSGYMYVHVCRRKQGYICENDIPILNTSVSTVLSSSVTSMYEEPASATSEEITPKSTIPLWIILVPSIAASLVIGATVSLCLRRRYKRKSARHVTKTMPPSGEQLESSAGDSLQPPNQIQVTDNATALGHLLETPSTEMYAVPHMSKRGNQYSDVILDNEDVSEKGLSAPKPVFKVQETERKGDVYAEVNLGEKRKYTDDGDNTSECDYSTTLVENTIYGE